MKLLKVLCLLFVFIGLIFAGCSKMVPTEPNLFLDDGGLSSLAKKGTHSPSDYEKKASKGIYYLVTKDGNLNALPRSDCAFGMGKFSNEDGTLIMNIVAHKLTPGDWYRVELKDKGSNNGTPLNNGDPFDNDAQFYGQADDEGNVKINFSFDISGYDHVEINVKNANSVYVLYGMTTIPLSISFNWCASCGSEIPGNATTCPECGAEI